MLAKSTVCLLAFVVAIGTAAISHRVHVLTPAVCHRRSRARRGDVVSLWLSASGLAGDVSPVSGGLAKQKHVVGKHPVAPLNNALEGMCEGERQKVTIFWGGSLAFQYIVELAKVGE